MASIILGKTPCPICGKPLQTGEDAVSFAPFVANRRDRLYRFSDAAFHRRCFDQDPLAQEALQRSEEVRKRGGPGHRRCVVCGEEILSPEEHFGTGFLTGDEANPVFEFNHLHLHRSHFDRWDRSAEFRRRIEAFQASEAWEGPMVRFDPMPSWVVPPSLLRAARSL